MIICFSQTNAKNHGKDLRDIHKEIKGKNDKGGNWAIGDIHWIIGLQA